MSRLAVGCWAFGAAGWGMVAGIDLALGKSHALLFDVAMVALYIFIAVLCAGGKVRPE